MTPSAPSENLLDDLPSLIDRQDATTLLSLLRRGAFDWPSPDERWWYHPGSEEDRWGSKGMGLASDVGHLLSHTAIGTATFGRGWPDLGPRVPETLPIWTLPIDEPMRLFHSEFARHLFTQAQTLRLLDRPKVVNTLGLTLATACALGDTTTVALIATGCQQAMQVPVHVGRLGTAVDPWFNHMVDSPALNACFFAFQFSHWDCVQSLVTAGHDPSSPTGMGPKSFSFSRLLEITAPACDPLVMDAMLKRYLGTGKPTVVQARGVLMQEAAHRALDTLGRPEAAAWQRLASHYLPNWVRSGVLWDQPFRCSVQACASGVSELVDLACDRVDWEGSLGQEDGLMALVRSLEDANPNDPSVDRSVLLWLLSADAAGQGDRLVRLRRVPSSLWGQPDAVEPVTALVRAGLAESLAWLIERGVPEDGPMTEGGEGLFDHVRRVHPQVEARLRAAIANRNVQRTMRRLQFFSC